MNRINKLNLSKTAESIFIKTILSYSHSPNNLNNEDFTDIAKLSNYLLLHSLGEDVIFYFFILNNKLHYI